MKLTNSMRDAFIHAVMKDTPAADLKTIEEAVHKIAVDDALSRAPAEVKAMWADNNLKPWVATVCVGFSQRTHGAYFSSVYVPAATHAEGELSQKALVKVKVLGGQRAEAEKKRYDLQDMLRRAAYGCSTRKQLAEVLPEFEKYLPADEGKALRSLPVVANVVSEFVKAGWPKGGKKSTK